MSVFKFLLLVPIWFYRYFLSPVLGPSCRFQPTCSEYMAEAVSRHGAWAGLWLGLKRLAACHPVERLGGRHGFDPVPVEIFRPAWYAPWRVSSSDCEAKCR